MKLNKTMVNQIGGAAITLTGIFNALPSQAHETKCRPTPKIIQSGEASYYADRFHGRTTANGEKFNMHALTAASKTLPFGTRVLVEHGDNKVVVRINDRGPYAHGRIIDLSKEAAHELDLIKQGTGHVTLRLCR